MKPWLTAALDFALGMGLAALTVGVLYAVVWYVLTRCVGPLL